MPNSFTEQIVPVGSADGDPGPQGPPERGRRLVPRPGEAGLAHARGRARHLRRAAAGARRAVRAPGGAAGACAPLSPEAGVPAARRREAVLGGRPDLQPRLPRAPHGAAEAWQRRPAARAPGPHLLPAAGPLEAALGALDRARARGRALRADLEDAPRAGGRRL